MIPTDIKVDHEYHIVELTTYGVPPPINNWLYEKFGRPGKRWFAISQKVYFESKHDHLLFLLHISSL